ncbi:hypothetical protein Aduo_013679 [Ancylostoma duodenale]
MTSLSTNKSAVQVCMSAGAEAGRLSRVLPAHDGNSFSSKSLAPARANCCSEAVAATSCCYTQVMLLTTPPTDRPIVDEDDASDGVNMSECEQHAPQASVTCAPHHARRKIRQRLLHIPVASE